MVYEPIKLPTVLSEIVAAKELVTEYPKAGSPATCTALKGEADTALRVLAKYRSAEAPT